MPARVGRQKLSITTVSRCSPPKGRSTSNFENEHTRPNKSHLKAKFGPLSHVWPKHGRYLVNIGSPFFWKPNSISHLVSLLLWCPRHSIDTSVLSPLHAGCGTRQGGGPFPHVPFLPLETVGTKQADRLWTQLLTVKSVTKKGGSCWESTTINKKYVRMMVKTSGSGVSFPGSVTLSTLQWSILPPFPYPRFWALFSSSLSTTPFRHPLSQLRSGSRWSDISPEVPW